MALSAKHTTVTFVFQGNHKKTQQSQGPIPNNKLIQYWYAELRVYVSLPQVYPSRVLNHIPTMITIAERNL